jgi:hypothetical protein
MVSTNVVLALVVSKILFSWVVLDVKLPCFNCIRNPEKLNLHRSRALFINRVIGNAYCRGVVAMYQRRWLQMSHFF